MKKAVFWDVAPCRYCVNLRFGGMYLLRLQGRKKEENSFLGRGFSSFFFYPENGGDTFLRNVG
jgi:hypothetical protein